MEFASKFLYFTLLGAIALLSCSHLAQSVGHDSSIGFCNDITWGRSAPMMTKVVHKQNNRLFRSVLGRKVELTLRFPEKGEFSAPIKCIMLRDNFRDGRGAFTRVDSGGVGYRHAVIYFRSQGGGDIVFDVGIYADPSRAGGGGNFQPQPQYSAQPSYPAVQPAYNPGWRPQPQPQPPIQQHQPQYGWNYPTPNHTYVYGR